MKVSLSILALSLVSVASAAELALVQQQSDRLGEGTQTMTIGNVDDPFKAEISIGPKGILARARSQEGEDKSEAAFAYESTVPMDPEIIKNFPNLMTQSVKMIQEMAANGNQLLIDSHPRVEEID